MWRYHVCGRNGRSRRVIARGDIRGDVRGGRRALVWGVLEGEHKGGFKGWV